MERIRIRIRPPPQHRQQQQQQHRVHPTTRVARRINAAKTSNPTPLTRLLLRPSLLIPLHLLLPSPIRLHDRIRRRHARRRRHSRHRHRHRHRRRRRNWMCHKRRRIEPTRHQSKRRHRLDRVLPVLPLHHQPPLRLLLPPLTHNRPSHHRIVDHLPAQLHLHRYHLLPPSLRPAQLVSHSLTGRHRPDQTPMPPTTITIAHQPTPPIAASPHPLLHRVRLLRSMHLLLSRISSC